MATPKNLPFPRIFSLIFCGLYETGKQNKDSFLLFHYYFPFFFSFLPFFTFFLPPLLPLNSLKKLFLSKVPLPPPPGWAGGNDQNIYPCLSLTNVTKPLQTSQVKFRECLMFYFNIILCQLVNNLCIFRPGLLVT